MLTNRLEISRHTAYPEGGVPAIDYFNLGHPLRRFASGFALRAREGQWRLFEEHFGSLLTKELRVLDLGTTPDDSLPDSNLFARRLKGRVNLTLSSPEDCRAVATALGARYLIPEELGAEKFDLVVSIATLEHCGGPAAQAAFARGIEARAPYFFVTTPYRWFPLEFHTFLPLLHWLPRGAHRFLLRKLFRDSFWSREENLHLLGAKEAKKLFSTKTPELFQTFSYLFALPSNLILLRSPRTIDTK